MGFYLSRSKEIDKRYGVIKWPKLIELARAFGWEPVGTTLTETKNWSGSYTAMNHQWVSDEDANNLADALERALVFFPRDDQEKTLSYQVKTNLWRPPTPEESKTLGWFFKNEADILSHEQSIADFVAYCREGGFNIH